MQTIKILIANKYFLMNYAIRCILQRIKGFEVYGVPETDILPEIEKLEPDILIIEVEMIKSNSLELISEIKKRFQELKIMVLLDVEHKNKFADILQLELSGYLSKNISHEELIRATRHVHKGEKYFTKEINQYLIDNAFEQNDKEKLRNIISIREKEILHLIVSGSNNKEIAKKLYISHNTVLTHRRNIMKKLKVKNTAQLITTSVKYGIITIKH